MLYIILPLLFSIVMFIHLVKGDKTNTNIVDIIGGTLFVFFFSGIIGGVLMLGTTFFLTTVVDSEKKLVESTEYEMVTYHPEYNQFIATNLDGVKETMEIKDKEILMYEVDEGFKIDTYNMQFNNKHIQYLLPYISSAEYHVYLKGED